MSEECPNCGREYDKPIKETKNWEIIPHDRNKNNDEHESIYVWGCNYELDNGIFRFYDEQSTFLEIPEILIYEIKELR